MAADKTNIDQLDDENIDYTPTRDLLGIQAYDSTVEIVGFVDAIEATKIVGVQGHSIFKFFINNGMGDRIQIITWNKEIGRIESHIRVNYIVHLDGAYCKPSLNKNFNKGTMDFELIIQSNTIVNVLGKQKVESTEDTDPELIEIEDAAKYSKCIKIQGFVKSRFAVIKKHSDKRNEFKCGSITDGEWKLEIHIPIHTDEEQEEHDFEKGDHVQIVGFTQLNANPIHFLAKTMKNIKKIDHQRMTLKNLLGGTKNVEKQYEKPKEVSVKRQKLIE